MANSAKRKRNQGHISRASVHFALIAGVTSYWALFLTPLIVCLLMIWMLITSGDSLWSQPGLLLATVVVLIHGGILFLILYGRVRKPRIWGRSFGLTPTTPGVLLSMSDAPELFAIAERYCQETGLANVPEIWVDLSANATNFVHKASKESKLKSAILIGLPALSVLSATDLELLIGLNVAVICISHGLRMRAAALRAFASRSPFVFRTLLGGVNYFKVMGVICNKALIRAEKYAFQVGSGSGEDVKAAVEDLRRIATGYQRFWMEHGNMMLHSGHVVPLLQGFADYWTTLYPNEVAAGRPAISLFRSAPTIEARLVNRVVKSNPTLDSISWSQAAPALLTSWQDYLAPRKDALVNIRVGNLCDLDLVTFARGVFQQPGRLYDSNQLKAMGSQLLGVALAMALSRAGWEFLYSGPASPLAFRTHERTLEPFRVLGSLFDGSITSEQWRDICSDNEIADLLLA